MTDGQAVPSVIPTLSSDAIAFFEENVERGVWYDITGNSDYDDVHLARAARVPQAELMEALTRWKW